MTRIKVWLCVTALSLVVASVLWATLVMAASISQAGNSPAAATITVTTTADTISCGTPCSLRGAILVANSGDTIIIPAGTYTLTLDAELRIGKSLTLTGDGADTTIIQAAANSGDATHRVFNINGGSVAISGVTIRHGKVSGDGGGILSGGGLSLTNSDVIDNVSTGDSLSRGGGIRNFGTLNITDSTINGNTARDGGGGIYNSGTLTVNSSAVNGNVVGGPHIPNFGGGIYSTGILIITNSMVSGNTAPDAGGILNAGGTLTLTSSTVSSNTATGATRTTGAGGGIFNTGTATLTNATISGNTAGPGHTGGGIFNCAACGGPSATATISVLNSTINGNGASGGGGGIHNNDASTQSTRFW